MRAAWTITAILALTLLCAARSAEADTTFCHDVARDLVRPTHDENCEGRIVDAAEAQAIRDRRAARIKRALEQPDEASFGGLRLAGVGTGFYVSNKAHLLTNHHVIAECRGIAVTGTDRATRAAELVASDETDDLALLEVANEPQAVAPIHLHPDWMPGDQVTIVGYPVHGLASLSAVGVSGQILRSTSPGAAGRIAISASIRRGTSGGPVLDRNGLVVGVIFARVDTVRIYAETGRASPDVAIAVDHPTLLGFLERNKVKFRLADPTSFHRPRDIVGQAQRYMARVQCYK